MLAIPETRLSELEGAPNLTHHDQTILYDIIDILTPFEEATHLFRYIVCHQQDMFRHVLLVWLIISKFWFHNTT